MHPDWARSIRDQCVAARVPFFFKQWGEWGYGSYPEVDRYRERRLVCADGRWGHDLGDLRRLNVEAEIRGQTVMTRVGKKAAGRLLDGRTWDQLPAGEAAQAADNRKAEIG